MNPCLKSLLGCLLLACTHSAATGGEPLATIPKVPESGVAFKVADLRELAELHLGKPAVGVKYQWTVKATEGEKSVSLRAAGIGTIANSAFIEIKRARPNTTYSFKLRKSLGDQIEESGELIVRFEGDGISGVFEHPANPSPSSTPSEGSPPARVPSPPTPSAPSTNPGSRGRG
jgi:hypothetical protein